MVELESRTISAIDNVLQETYLSVRQRQVASLLALGLEPDAISERLGIRRGTLKAHTNAVFNKLGVRSRSQLSGMLLSQLVHRLCS